MTEESQLPTNAVLSRYISGGKVDYRRLCDEPWVWEKIREIEGADLSSMTGQQRLAFWLNAYNLITIKAVMEKLERDPQWPGVTSPFRKFSFFIWRRHRIAGKRMSLYYLENRIIRKFGDPRIHFAINCASGSCPYLPEKLFVAEGLDIYLETLATSFINSQGGARLDGSRLVLSKIFEMYRGDFGGGDEDLISYIRSYWKGDWTEPHTLVFADYDWSLNGLNA